MGWIELIAILWVLVLQLLLLRWIVLWSKSTTKRLERIEGALVVQKLVRMNEALDKKDD